MNEKLNVKSAKNRGNSTKNTMIALFLVLTIAVTLVVLPSALPIAKAHKPAWNFPIYTYLSVQPNPVTVGTAAFVNFWLDKPPPTAAGAYGDRWQGFKVTVTKPDGTTQDLPLGSHSNSDAVGGSYTIYTPTVVGKYTFVFSFPGQTIAGANPNPATTTPNVNVGDYYEPSTSDPVTLTVQQEQIPTAPSNPLPTGYWQRPIYAENTAWYTISGNWLGYNAATIGGGSGGGAYYRNQAFGGNFDPYTTAPNSAHIVWTKPYAPGGLIGGEYGGSQENSNYYSSAQYETKFAPIVMNGVLYYGLMPGASTNRQGWVAVDIRTGQTIWTKNTTAVLNTGQILDFVSPNQFGGLAYLWSIETTVAPNTGTTYGMYDAMTGNWILNIVNGTAVWFMPDLIGTSIGSLLGYYINTTDWTLNMWNSTRGILKGPTGTGDLANAWRWTPPTGASIPFSYGIQWSVPMTINMTASNGTIVNINKVNAEAAGVATSNLAISRISDGVIVVDNTGIYFTEPGWIISEGYSAKTGQLIWGPLNTTLQPWCRLGTFASGTGDGVWALFTHETLTWSGYSITTGQLLWGPVKAPSNSWSYYQMHAMIAYGNLYTADFGGYVNCYDDKTGTLKWTWKTGSSGYETPYGIWPIINFELIADGKLYVIGGHMYSPPLFHGAQLYCINATTGQEIWSISDFGIANVAACAAADGYLLMPNAYDNQIYCYNKGQSTTTVSAPDTAIPKGTPMLIKGTVTDQSPGQTCLGIPAAGTPAISDDNMTAWMEYLYQQQPKPTNVKGVPVHLTAVDPNGNTQEIGTATSNDLGNYAIEWTPPISGLYTVRATFAGSNSYFSSEAGTAFVISEATSALAVVTPTPTPSTMPTSTPAQTTSPSPAPQPEAGPSTDMYVIAAAAVIVIVVVAVAALALRKRK